MERGHSPPVLGCMCFGNLSRNRVDNLGPELRTGVCATPVLWVYCRHDCHLLRHGSCWPGVSELRRLLPPTYQIKGLWHPLSARATRRGTRRRRLTLALVQTHRWTLSTPSSGLDSACPSFCSIMSLASGTLATSSQRLVSFRRQQAKRLSFSVTR